MNVGRILMLAPLRMLEKQLQDEHSICMASIIKQIEITKFRSISRETIDLADLTIFSGKNNSGKSNILRALNLFFNGKSSFNQPHSHARDYNKAYTGRMGGRREIEIRILFKGQGTKALANDFYITRRFDEGGFLEFEYSYPGAENNITDGNIRKQFTRFRNSIRHFYIPAVRDRDFVQELFLYFEDLLEAKKGGAFNANISDLSKILKEKSLAIATDFRNFINLETSAELSSNISDILGSTKVNVKSGIKTSTKSGKTQDIYIDLFSSGDGILMSYIPHFLNHISENLKQTHFIWGFEEPENSLEFSRVALLAEKFNTSFKKNSQIIVTSHSPAFISLGAQRGNSLFRVYIDSTDPKQATKIVSIPQLYEKQAELFKKGRSESAEYKILSEELGLHLLNEEIYEAYKKELDVLNDKVSKITNPTIITEGNNIRYLEKAKLFFDPKGKYEIQDGGGKDEMKTLYRHFSRNLPHKKIAFVWDPDCKSFVGALPQNPQLMPIALERETGRDNNCGIEGLFSEKWFKEPGVIKPLKGSLPGVGSRGLDKKKFMDNVLKKGTLKDFDQFRPHFEILKKFFK